MEKLFLLAEKWKQRARSKVRSASFESSDFGRRFIEHGAMCYANCADELIEALSSLEPQTSAIQEVLQKKQ